MANGNGNASLPVEGLPQGINPQAPQGMVPTAQPQVQAPFMNTSTSIQQATQPTEPAFELGDFRLRGLPSEVQDALAKAIEAERDKYAQQNVSRLQSLYDQRLAQAQQQISYLNQQVLHAQLEGRSEEDQAALLAQHQTQQFQQQYQQFQQERQQFQAQQQYEREVQHIATTYGVPAEQVRAQPSREQAYAWAAQQQAIRQMMPQIPQHQVNQVPVVPGGGAVVTGQQIPRWDTPEFGQMWEAMKNGGGNFF